MEWRGCRAVGVAGLDGGGEIGGGGCAEKRRSVGRGGGSGP